MTQNLLNYQAPNQVAKEPTSAFAKVPLDWGCQICIATCTTGSVSPKQENVKPFFVTEPFLKTIRVFYQKRDEEQFRQFNMSAAILTTALTISYFLSLVGYLFSNVSSNRKRQIMISSNHIVMDIDGLFQAQPFGIREGNRVRSAVIFFYSINVYS